MTRVHEVRVEDLADVPPAVSDVPAPVGTDAEIEAKAVYLEQNGQPGAAARLRATKKA